MIVPVLTLPDLTSGWTVERIGTWAQVLLGKPLEIAIILVVAVIARFLIHRAIDRITSGIAAGRAGLGRLDDRLPSATARLNMSALHSSRHEQRAQTMASVLKSLTTAVVAAFTVIYVMDALGQQFITKLTPLLASAGIAGVALGFGAQSLVKDVIAGVFMIVEDQYGVGDVVDLGEASGLVEAVGLRVSRLRDVDGTVWYIRNGEILRVGNRSQGWSRAVLDIAIAYGENIGRVQDLLLEVARDLQKDETFGSVVLEDPEVWGVESVSAEAVVIRLVVKTQPLQQWAVARELRRRIMDRFTAEQVKVAYPQSAVWVNGSPAGPGPVPASDGKAQPTAKTQPEAKTQPTAKDRSAP